MPEHPPSTEADPRLTLVLQEARAGDAGALSQLMDLVLADLRRCAAGRIAAGPTHGSIRPTELINDAYLRLFGRGGTPDWRDRAHFFAVAAIAMQQILIDRARRRRVRERGGPAASEFADREPALDAESERLVALAEALEALEARAERQASVVRLKFFAGLTIAEIARLTGASESTVERDWAAARLWLRQRLEEDAP